MYRQAFLAFVVFCCLFTTAHAVPTITAGNHFLFPGPGQIVPVLISGVSPADDIAGVDLALNIGAGPGTPLVMTSVDIVGPGTLFNASNTGQTDFLPYPTVDQFSLTTTIAPTVLNPNGVLAFVTIDATGGSPGVYPFNLTNFIGPSDLPPFATPTLVNGILILEPEPGSIVLALFAVGGLYVVAMRRRRMLF